MTKQKAWVPLVCILVFMYALPFFIEPIARSHVMFFRYLIVKQVWWAEHHFALYFSIVGFCLLVGSVLLLLAHRKQKRMIMPHMINIVVILIDLVIININPELTLMFFFLLIAAPINLVLSYLGIWIFTKGHILKKHQG